MKNKSIGNGSENEESVVFPGTKIAVIEEFLGGPGTYIEEDSVYSSVYGTVSVNLNKYEISILSKPKMRIVPKEGDEGIGVVVGISKQMVTIALNYISNQEVYPTYTCFIHVSQISKDYLDNADELVSIGDIMRCKIIDAKTIPLQATLIGSSLGNLISYCNKCGLRLEKVNRDQLKCTECNSIQKRKTAMDYGNGNMNLSF